MAGSEILKQHYHGTVHEITRDVATRKGPLDDAGLALKNSESVSCCRPRPIARRSRIPDFMTRQEPMNWVEGFRNMSD
jgi:hypothetical protein